MSPDADTFSKWLEDHPAATGLWENFDQEYMADVADRLVAIGQYELGFRLPGTESGRQAADLIAHEMQRIGLQEVRKEPFPVHGWDFKGASLEIHTEPPQTFIASSFAASPGTPPNGLTADLVDVGHGTTTDYLGLDVRDKIAFVHADFTKWPWMGQIVHEAELHGAAGVVMYYLNEHAQHESGEALNCQDANLRETIPVLHVSRNTGQALVGLLAQGPVPATLHCRVTNNPNATGYNVLGVLPGTRWPDRYLLLQAHYDTWFYGYWDNTIGVAGVLAIAKALIKSGYQPQHTIIFVSPDAEEFGAPDTAFGWLYGCQHLLEAHPDWPGRMTCALNIDTLAHRWQDGVQFIGPAEMLAFMRQVMNGYPVRHFPLPEVYVAEQITPWTEVYNYTYFGIPSLQPRFKTDDDSVRTTIYHTQFDDASLVDLNGAAEILKLYGTLLVSLDQQPGVPYNFSERSQSIRTSLDDDFAQDVGAEVFALDKTLLAFDLWAEKIEGQIRQTNQPDGAVSPDTLVKLNDYLRDVTRKLLPSLYFIEGDFPDTGQYEHRCWQREVIALDKAIASLEAGDGTGAIAILTDQETGVLGGWYAPYVSYPVYHKNIHQSRNSARTDLYWGKDRTIPLTDIWAEIQILQDKNQRGLTDFAPEIYALRQKRDVAAAGYRAALQKLSRLLRVAIGEDRV